MEKNDYLKKGVELDAQMEELQERMEGLKRADYETIASLIKEYERIAKDPRAFVENDPLMKMVSRSQIHGEPIGLYPWFLFGDYMREEIAAINALVGHTAKLEYRYLDKDDEQYHVRTIEATLVKAREGLDMFKAPIIQLITLEAGKEEDYDLGDILTCNREPLWGGLIGIKTEQDCFPSTVLLNANKVAEKAIERYYKIHRL